MLQSDITSVVADAIVHPTNSGFYLGGQVGRALENKGNVLLRNEIDRVKKDGNIPESGGKFRMNLI